MKMNDLKIGQYGYVKEMKTSSHMRRRLQDIGLVQGTKVQCVLNSPNQDPNAYLIRGATIALRNEDIQEVEIQGLNICG